MEEVIFMIAGFVEKQSLRLFLIVAVAVSGVFSAFFLFSENIVYAQEIPVAEAQSNSGFQYKKEITIDNSSGGEDLTNYNIKVIISEASGDNFNYELNELTDRDLLFLDDGEPLTYRVESFDQDKKEVVVWVTVPIIPAKSSRVIAMYYGIYNLPKEEVVAINDTTPAVVKSVPSDNLIGSVIDDPTVESFNEKIAAPVVTAVVVVNVATAVPSLGSLWAYLHYIFTEPFIFIFRRRRRSWGVVYNSLSKLPLDLAMVRLYNVKSKKLAGTSVTDQYGRYSFVSDLGDYMLDVSKAGFLYPTRFLNGQKEDSRYSDLYWQQILPIKNEKESISVNVPLDPIVEDKTARTLLRDSLKHKTQYFVSVLGMLTTICSYIISPKWYILLILAAHVFLFFAFRRIVVGRKPKGWGQVLDKDTGKPLARAVVKIFEIKFNKLLSSVVTDSLGRYHFLVGSNTYYLTVEKDGYPRLKSKEIKITTKEGDVVKENLLLKAGAL